MPNPLENPNSSASKESLDRAKIERYLAETLPESEKRIERPMDPRCDVAIVIPSAGERKFLFRPIESVLDQQGVKPEQMELLMVINNAVPKRKPDETDKIFQERLEQAQQGAQENQEVLKILRLLQGEDIAVELSDKEKALVQRVREAKLNVYAIDKASSGQTFPDERANVGSARNRGVAEAVERFLHIGKNGLIVQTDADTALDEHFIERALAIFTENPDLTGASGYVEMDTTVEQSEVMKQIHFFTGMDRLYRTLLNYYFTKEQDLPKRQNFTGANMISRAYETGVVGGVPEIGEKEDVDFGRRLDTIGKTTRLQTVISKPVARISRRTAGTKKGHGHILANMADEITQIGEIKVQPVEYREVVDQIEDAAVAAKDLQSFKRALNYKGTALLSDPEREQLFDSIQSGKPNKDLMNKVYQQMETLIPTISIFEASQRLMGRLCERESLCDTYLDELVQPTKQLEATLPAGIHTKHFDMYKKLQAMDTAKRKQ